MLKIFGVVLFAVVFLSTQVGAAPYSGAWAPNSDDVFAIAISTQDGDGIVDLWLYDWGNSGEAMQILSGGPFSNTTVYFVYDDTGTENFWYATTADPDTHTYTAGTDVLLGEDTSFGFYFNSFPEGSTYDVQDESGDAYELTSTIDGDTDVVIVHDAAPVPIPATVFLLSSGLLGLIGLRRKSLRKS